MIFIGLGLVLFGASSMKSLQTRKTEKVLVVSGCGLCGRHGGPVLCFLFASLISTRVKSIKARSRQQKRTVDLLKDLKRQKMPQFCRLAADRVLFSKSLVYGPRCPMWFTSSSVCASWPSTWYTASPGTSSWTRPFVCMFATFSLPSRPLNVFSMCALSQICIKQQLRCCWTPNFCSRLFPNVSDCFNFSGRPLWLVSDWWPMWWPFCGGTASSQWENDLYRCQSEDHSEEYRRTASGQMFCVFFWCVSGWNLHEFWTKPVMAYDAERVQILVVWFIAVL